MNNDETFRAALAARDLGNYEQSEKLLASLVAGGFYSADCFATLGRVRWELSNTLGAISAFAQAVQLAPDSELASLGLFHSLWMANRTDDAFEEMKRYLKAYSSDEYSRLLRDLNEDDEES